MELSSARGGKYVRKSSAEADKNLCGIVCSTSMRKVSTATIHLQNSHEATNMLQFIY